MKKTFLTVAAILFGIVVFAQDRPASAGADVASPSDNVPPKKETLTQKIKRYESAGYKVGVYFSTPDLFVLNPTGMASGPTATSSNKKPLLIEDAESVCDCFADKTDDVIAKLNAQYGTDIFERVDISKIPYRKVMGMNADDWWNTKYKAVVHVLVANQYEVYYMGTSTKLTADYKTTLTMAMVEYINEKNGKQKYIAQSAAAVFTESYENEDAGETKDWKIADVRENVGGPSNDALTSAYESGYEDVMNKLIDKLKKKK